MKEFKLFFVLAFVNLTVIPFYGFSQAKKSINTDFEISIGVIVNNNIVISYPLTGVEFINVTPSGNLTRVVTLHVDPSDPIMALADPVAFLTVNAWGDFDGDGTTEFIVDEKAVLTSSGNLKLIYHINGKSK